MSVLLGSIAAGSVAMAVPRSRSRRYRDLADRLGVMERRYERLLRKHLARRKGSGRTRPRRLGLTATERERTRNRR